MRVEETTVIDGRRWHRRDYGDHGFMYSRDGEEYDVVLFDQHDRPTGRKRVRTLDELEPKKEARAERDPGPDRPWVVQMPPKGCIAPPLYGIRPTPGTVFVEMDVYREEIGGVFLTDLMRGALRPDSGWVIASIEKDLQIGTHVVLAPYGGNEFDGFEIGAVRAEGRVKIYGSASRDPYETEYEDWRDNIMAEIVAERLRAMGDWALLRRDPTVKTENGLELPDGMQYRTHKATVVSAGPDSGVSDGDRVMYHGPAIMYGIAFDQGDFGLEGDVEDYCFIRGGNLYGVIDE